jgi:hypothetical protein
MEERVMTVSTSFDGNIIVTALENYGIYLLDAERGTVLTCLREPNPTTIIKFPLGGGWPLALFSPSTYDLLLGWGNDVRMSTLMNPATSRPPISPTSFTHQEIAEFRSTDSPYEWAWNGESRLLFCASAQGSVECWSRDGEPQFILASHDDIGNAHSIYNL